MMEPNPGNLRWQVGLCLMRIADEIRAESLGGLRNHVRWLTALSRPWIKGEPAIDPCKRCGRGARFVLPSEDLPDEEEFERLMEIVEDIVDILANKGIVARAAEPDPADGSELAKILAERRLPPTDAEAEG